MHRMHMHPPSPPVHPPPAWKAGYEKRWGSGQKEKNAWRVATAPPTRTFSFTTWKIRPRNPLFGREVGRGGRYEWRLGLAHFHNEYCFLMISPNLHDISPLFLLIPSPVWTAHLLTLIRLLGDGYSLLGSKKIASPAQTFWQFFSPAAVPWSKTICLYCSTGREWPGVCLGPTTSRCGYSYTHSSCTVSFLMKVQ
jgi:hypothetical protein